MNTKLTKEEILTKLQWLNKIKIADDSYAITFGAAMVLHNLKSSTSDIDIFVSLRWYIYLIFRKIFDRSFSIPNKISIYWKGFLRTSLKTEKLYGYNVQTLKSIRDEKLKRNRINDKLDIQLINNCLSQKSNMNNSMDYDMGAFYPSIKISSFNMDPDILLYKALFNNSRPLYHEYKIAHLLGKTRNNELLFRHVEKVLTLQGYICFTPVIYNLEEYLQYPEMLDNMCYQKLLMSDICVIVTPDHIGESTTKRIQQCKEFNIPLYVFEDEQLTKYE